MLPTWGRRASGALPPGFMPTPLRGFVAWQFGAGAQRRRQAASLREWNDGSKGRSLLRATPQELLSSARSQ